MNKKFLLIPLVLLIPFILILDYHLLENFIFTLMPKAQPENVSFGAGILTLVTCFGLALSLVFALQKDEKKGF